MYIYNIYIIHIYIYYFHYMYMCITYIAYINCKKPAGEIMSKYFFKKRCFFHLNNL